MTFSNAIKSLSKTIFNKKLNIAHAVVICLLVTISIYSMYAVLYSYCFENISTNTIVQMASNPLPFADGMTVSYAYANASIFPGTWQMARLMPSGRQDYLRTLKRFKAGRTFSNPENMSLEDAMDIAMICGVIRNYDDEFLHGFTQHHRSGAKVPSLEQLSDFFSNFDAGVDSDENLFPTMIPGANNAETAAIVNKYLENSEANLLHDQAISGVFGETFLSVTVPRLEKHAYHPFSLKLDSFWSRGIEVFIPFDFSKNMSTHILEFAILPTKLLAPNVPVFSKVEATIAPFLLPGLVGAVIEPTLLKNPMIETTIYLQNNGIFDSTNVHASEKCRRCSNLTSAEHCEFKCLVSMVIDLCRCMPFSFRRLFKFEFPASFPRCTTKHYAQCLKTSKFDIESCLTEKAVPCLMKQNSQVFSAVGYNILHEIPANSNLSEEWYRLRFKIICQQRAYVITRDQFQNNWMEMLGQLGGNLGVFLSFSLFGLWQFFVFAYTTYKEHRRMTKASYSAASVLIAWLHLARSNIGAESAEDHNASNDLGQKDDVVLSDINAMTEKFKTSQREIKELKERLDSLEHQMKSRKDIQDVRGY